MYLYADKRVGTLFLSLKKLHCSSVMKMMASVNFLTASLFSLCRGIWFQDDVSQQRMKEYKMVMRQFCYHLRNSGKINPFVTVYCFPSRNACVMNCLNDQQTILFSPSLTILIMDNVAWGQKIYWSTFCQIKEWLPFIFRQKNLAPPSKSWWGEISIELSATIIRAYSSLVR